MTSRLHSWAGVGTFLVAAAVTGYAGITVAQAVSLATADDLAVAAVAEPPVVAAPYSTTPAAPTAPATPTADPVPTAAPSADQPAGPFPAVAAEAPKPGTRAEQPAGPADRRSEDDAGPSRSAASAVSARKVAARAAAPAAEASRRERLEIKHAMWADRQLAAMLRATSQPMQWFGGAPWIAPVADYHLTARFGASGRLWSSTHTGLDFAAPTGTPVRAATAGTVTSVAWAGAYGNKIEITHPDGTETWYAHLSRTDVRVGAQVGTGAVIGAVGATGNVTGSHLHLEVRSADGSPVDPERTLEEHGVHP